MVFSGCSCKTTPFVRCEVQYIDREVEVEVPVRCATPNTFCDLEGSIHSGEMGELLNCIYELRKSTKVCKDK